MGIIKAAKLAFDYLRYDEDGNVEDTQRAVDGVDLDIQPGEFVAVKVFPFLGLPFNTNIFITITLLFLF